MTNEKYNGWTNRETWLVNLYFGDSFNPMIDEDINNDNLDTDQDKNDLICEIASRYEDYVIEILDEELEGLSGFLKDFLDLGLIDWYDLAESIYEEIKIAI